MKLMMTKQELHILFIDYISNKISREDHDRLMDEIAAAQNDPELYVFMEKIWDSQPVGQSFSDLQAEVLYQQIIADSRFTAQPAAPKPAVRKFMYRIVAAAAVLLIAVTAILQYANKGKVPAGKDSLAETYIPPGGNKALLTLENGEQIVLTDMANGSVVIRNGIKITKTGNGQLIYALSETPADTRQEPSYNTIETPAGGQFEIVLHDGTKVWLNANSSLRYPTHFDLFNTREVSLTGEGYFEVAPDKQRPFLVHTANQQIKVLGTHFNINTYTNEPQTVTTLLEGRVEVSTNTIPENRKVLKPGQQSVLDKNGLTISDADLEAALAWKNGYFIFRDEELGSIMRKIERWYDVDIVITEDMEKRTLGGATPRSKDLSSILRKLELTGNIHFKIEGRRITVMP